MLEAEAWNRDRSSVTSCKEKNEPSPLARMCSRSREGIRQSKRKETQDLRRPPSKLSKPEHRSPCSGCCSDISSRPVGSCKAHKADKTRPARASGEQNESIGDVGGRFPILTMHQSTSCRNFQHEVLHQRKFPGVRMCRLAETHMSTGLEYCQKQRSALFQHDLAHPRPRTVNRGWAHKAGQSSRACNGEPYQSCKSNAEQKFVAQIRSNVNRLLKGLID